jgi:hypothetical protein
MEHNQPKYRMQEAQAFSATMMQHADAFNDNF